MKHAILLIVLIVFGCSGPKTKPLNSAETDQIKRDIIKSYEKHIDDLINLDYPEVMKYYADDHTIFGDGYYWGDYQKIDEIWKHFLGTMRVITKWDLRNHHVYVFSRDAASYLVEFDNERVEGDGDTTKVTGCFSFGMKKFPDGWKVVTQHVTHNYLKGYDPRVK